MLVHISIVFSILPLIAYLFYRSSASSHMWPFLSFMVLSEAVGFASTQIGFNSLFYYNGYTLVSVPLAFLMFWPHINSKTKRLGVLVTCLFLGVGILRLIYVTGPGSNDPVMKVLGPTLIALFSIRQLIGLAKLAKPHQNQPFTFYISLALLIYYGVLSILHIDSNDIFSFDPVSYWPIFFAINAILNIIKNGIFVISIKKSYDLQMRSSNP